MKTVIKIDNLWKEYRLGVIGHKMLAHDLQSWWSRARGNEDPNSKIDSLSQNQNKMSKANGRFYALRGVDLEVQQGEILGIVGKNGAGKSTLLKILSRVTAPSQGLIKVKGRIASLLEVGTGFHPELTGRENVFLNGAILGMQKFEIKRKLDEIIEFAGILRHIDTPVKRYSSGMHVRLAFAVAAHLDPEILVIDEVLAVGDADFQKKCLGKMESISGEGRTVLFVSHQMNAVEKLCSRGIVLEQGAVNYESENIRDVIGHYLSSGGGDHHLSPKWINDDSTGSNRYFEPEEFFITDEKGALLTLPIKNSEDIYVNIKFEIKEIDPALSFGYELFNSEHKHVFICNQTDGSQSSWPKLRVGANHVRSKIPRHLLNEGNYYIKMAACLYNRIWLVHPGKDSVKLDISIRGGFSDSPYWVNKRDGDLAPIYLWEQA